jgi:hypothetical protein
MDTVNDILVSFELHDTNGIRRAIANGVDPCMDFKGVPLIYQLVTMYTRGNQFRQCMREMEAHGAVLEDPVLQAVLTNDAAQLRAALIDSHDLVVRRYSLPCTFTPLDEVTLLHICVEYGHLDCAALLVEFGADVNAKAGIDVIGFGGHSPVFHAVNQHQNFNLAVLEFLLSQGATLDNTVAGLIWGKGFEWETYIPSVNPISYAMMGLLRQFQRNEKDVYMVVDRLMRARYDIKYQPENLPNRYLQ